MNQQEIIDTTGCPVCPAKAYQPCRNPNGSNRKKNHVERLYRAQDIATGKPDRVTGKLGVDHMADRRCPICSKLLKSPQGANDHIVQVHGLTRPDAKAARKKYRLERDGFIRAQHNHLNRTQSDIKDDFDVLEDFEVSA